MRTRNVHRGAVRRVEAEIAGLGRTEFLQALARFEVSPFQDTRQSLKDELARELGLPTSWTSS